MHNGCLYRSIPVQDYTVSTKTDCADVLLGRMSRKEGGRGGGQCLVFWFFLTPHDISKALLWVLVLADGLDEEIVREGRQLLQPDQGNVPDLPLSACVTEVVVDGATAEDDPPHVLGLNQVRLPGVGIARQMSCVV